jgi:hypothetical protein
MSREKLEKAGRMANLIEAAQASGPLTDPG